jgi:hypothetical protein
MSCRSLIFDAAPASCLGRDSVGDCAVAGDHRWAGIFGVNVDFVARSHCSVALITVEDIQVMGCPKTRK